MPEIKIIEPGAYRLDHDVENPTPDRRHTRDWRKSPVWKAGMEFVVREQRDRISRTDIVGIADLSPEVMARLRALSRYTVIESVTDRHPSLHRIGPGYEKQYAALAAALVRTEESLAHFMSRIDCQSGFGSFLIESGAVDRARFEELWHRYQYGDDDEPSLDNASTDPPSAG